MGSPCNSASASLRGSATFPNSAFVERLAVHVGLPPSDVCARNGLGFQSVWRLPCSIATLMMVVMVMEMMMQTARQGTRTRAPFTPSCRSDNKIAGQVVEISWVRATAHAPGGGVRRLGPVSWIVQGTAVLVGRHPMSPLPFASTRRDKESSPSWQSSTDHKPQAGLT